MDISLDIQVDNINTWFATQDVYDDFLKYLKTRFIEVTENIMPKRILGINMHYVHLDKEESYESIEEILSKDNVISKDISEDKGISEDNGISKDLSSDIVRIVNDPKTWDCNMIVMEQYHYIEPIIKDIIKVKDILLPSTVNLNKLEKGDGVETLFEDMGSLRYLNDHTRPDFMTATTMMSSHMLNPGEKHIKLTNQIKQYLKGSKKEYKVIRKMEKDLKNMELFAYCDGSYLQDYDCKSYIGFNLFLDTTSSSIFDKCVKDGTVSRSSTIVEIKSIDLCVLYVITIRMFLMELGYNQQSAISNKNIYRFTAFFRYSEERTDNRQSTVYQCKDTFHSRVSAVRSSHL